LEKDSGQGRGELLQGLRSTILTLRPPDELMPSLYREMEKAGLPMPADREEAWASIKRVWGSKWNERAYLSRKSLGVPHDNLLMAVLVQEVIGAEYSFVIHTVNPLTGNKNEVYGEVVLGLGEALVGNYPGKALSFVSRKGEDAPEVRSFPDKSIGLRGSGLIFRSDSNGEDLAGYAGAGLYDSFILPTPEKVPMDYTKDTLVWDPAFRKDLLSAISRIGVTVEKVLSVPQDIEGAYSGEKYYVVQSRPQVGI
jgi:alpha-glucan,water dikinase